MTDKKPLYIRRTDTGEQVGSPVMTTRRQYQRVMLGMFINMREGLFIDDSAFDEPEAKP